MKILVDCSTAKMGGARTYLEQFLREISSRDLGQKWVVYGPPGFRATLEGSGSAVDLRERPLTITPSVGYLKWLARILPRLVTREGVDVVFAATGFGMMRPPCPQLLLIRNPIYFSRLYLSKIQNLRLKADVLARRWLSLRMIDRSDAVVFPTRAMQEMVAGYHSLEKVRCFIAPYGCDVGTFRQEIQQDAGLPEMIRQARGRFFLNVSHYCSQKNFPVLFKALGILRRRGMVQPLVLTTRLRVAPNCTFREDRAVIDSEHLDG
ncbi:MAG: hypothetical protein HYZ90_05015, partial [Candidatus Omnitrophica bacterium]|nr:hypothetical protein [Candidatus Omnitrophota bacterium]